MKHPIEIVICKSSEHYVGIPTALINEFFFLDKAKLFFRPVMFGIQHRREVKGFFCLSNRYSKSKQNREFESSVGVDITSKGYKLILGVDKVFNKAVVMAERVLHNNSEGIVAIAHDDKYGFINILSPSALIKCIRQEL